MSPASVIRRRSVRRFAIATIATLTAAGLPALAAGGPSSSSSVGFTTYPAPDGLGTDAGEPSIGVNWNTGNVMFQAYTQTLRVAFDDSTTPATATWADKSYELAATSMDPILYTDSKTGLTMTSQLISPAGVTGIGLLGCSIGATTTDDGDNWTPSEGCSTPGGVDHQTVGGGPVADPIGTEPGGDGVWYCSQDLVTARCGLSRDGGSTFGAGLPMYTLIGTQGSTGVGYGECGGLHGHVKVAPDGTAYVPNQQCFDETLGTDAKQAVIVSHDDGLTWTVDTIPDSQYNDFRSDPSVAIGSGGTVYFAYEDVDGAVKVAVQHPGGDWLPSVNISAPQGVPYGVFPAVVAGDDNRAAVAYLGTTTTSADDEVLYEDKNFTGAWHLYVAYTYDGGATWTTVDTTPTDPVQLGCIWWGNGDCPRDHRNLLDFMDATIDASGRVLVGYADGCLAGCTTPAQSIESLGTIARQSCGVGMFASKDGTIPPCGGTPGQTTCRKWTTASPNGCGRKPGG